MSDKKWEQSEDPILVNGVEFISSKKIVGLARDRLSKMYPQMMHRVSDLVVRKVDGIPYLASYVCFYNMEELSSWRLRRPAKWILMDFVSGEIKEVIDARLRDFSKEEYNRLYSTVPDGDYNVSREYYRSVYKVLDDFRLEYFKTGEFARELYSRYFKMVSRNVPATYRQFLKDLSDLSGDKKEIHRAIGSALE